MFTHAEWVLPHKDLECNTGAKGRTYDTPSGNKYPSITTVLGVKGKDALHEWRARVGEEEANRISRIAANRGTRVHTMAEDYVNNLDPIKKGDMPHMIKNFQQLKKVLDERVGLVYAQEAALYSNHLKIAGRVDCVAMFDGVLSIIDYKTSSKPKRKDWISNYFIQEAFYAIAWEELTAMPIVNLVTIIAVDDEKEAQVFVEHRDNWAPELLELRAEYSRRKLFGHI